MRNRFKCTKAVEQEIIDEQEEKIGTIRIKPCSVQWKPKNAKKWYTVPLSAFARYMEFNGTGKAH